MNAFPTIYRYICRKSLNDKFTNLTVTLARGIPNFWNPLFNAHRMVAWSLKYFAFRMPHATAVSD
jgi:hypothetical protein